MRFLKNKIARALELSKLHSHAETTSSPSNTQSQTSEIAFHLRSSEKGHPMPSQVSRRRRISAGNNIMKNYCRALINFGLSDVVGPYLIDAAENGVSCERFQQILHCKKRSVNCIKGLRSLLLHERRESKEMKEWKTMFQRSCEAFLKYFCVNWVFHSKIDDKLKHLRYRGRILRRVQNPEYFTYLEDFAKKGSLK